jgi:hypothetical protein
MMTILLLLASAGSTGPDFGAPKINGDWIAGCDNRGDCSVSNLLVAEDGVSGNADEGVYIKIDRAYDPRKPIAIGLQPVDKIPSSNSQRIRIDGRIMPFKLSWRDGQAIIAPQDSINFLRQMRSAKQLEVIEGKKVLASAPVDGLLPLLEYIDKEQYRIGTRGALARPGEKPADFRAIPPLVPQPNIKAPPLSSDPPTKLGRDKWLELLRSDPCSKYVKEGEPASAIADPAVEYVRLDKNMTLALLGGYCGGYNATTRLFLVDNIGNARPASFGPHPFKDPDEAEPMLPGAWWDEKGHQLGSFGRARGLGDCGQQVRYVWDGQKFVAVEYSSMPECRGSYNYVVTYRRDVQR